MPRFRMPKSARKPLPILVVAATASTLIAISSTPATAATPPVITSTDFPDGDAISPMVGEVGKLTIDSPDDDVKSYRVTIDSAFDDVEPSAPDEPVTVSYMPSNPGRQLVQVRALHADGTSSSASYSFRVSAKGPAASYDLADAAGSGIVSDSAGTNPGTPGPGVNLGVPGPKESTAAAFDGGEGSYVKTKTRGVVPSDEGFAVAAWVKVDDLSRDQTIVSINGCETSGFVLGYHSTSETTGTWMFDIPESDGATGQSERVTGGTVTQANHDQWVHVVGVYNDMDKSMRLYLNGRLIGTEIRDSTWRAAKTIQIGRSLDNGRYVRHLDGSLAEVRVFDRVVFADESDYLEAIAPERSAYWQLNANGSEYTGGAPLSLADGATIYTQVNPDDREALLGAGHLALDGDSGYAHTASDLVDTRLSFSVSARVQLARPVPDRDMTVFALPGENTNLVELKYAAAADSWRLVVAESDSATAGTVSVDHAIQPSTEYRGQSVAVTYDSFTGQAVLWVNGHDSEPLAISAPWPATGIQLGRSGPEAGYFYGAIDDVRVYSGACDADMIVQLDGMEELPDL